MASVVGRGTVLAGRYQLTDPQPCELPRATEWAATDQILVRPVVVRVFPAAGGGPALDAARRAALVTDPRLVRVLDVGSEDDIAYVVTEQVSGPTLARLVAREPLSAEQARAIVGEAANALEAARRRGVHHLALGPHSLSVSDDGRVVVSGTALDAALLGRPVGDARTTSRADAADLVRLVYAALTGHWPGPRETSGGLPTAPEDDGVPVPPASLAANVPGDLNTLCAVTLAREDDGPLSPADLVRELEPWGEIRIQAPSKPFFPPVSTPAPPTGGGPVVRQSVRSTFSDPAPSRPGTPPPAPPIREAVTPPMGVPAAFATTPGAPVPAPPTAPIPPAASVPSGPAGTPPAAPAGASAGAEGPFPATTTPPTIPMRTPTSATPRISAFPSAAGAAGGSAAAGAGAATAGAAAGGSAAAGPGAATAGAAAGGSAAAVAGAAAGAGASAATPPTPITPTVPTRTPTRPVAAQPPAAEPPRPAQPAPGGYASAHLPVAGSTPPSIAPSQPPPSDAAPFDFGQMDEQPPRRPGVGIAIALVGLLVVVAIGFAAKALFSGHSTAIDPGTATHTTGQSPTGTATSPNASPTASPTVPAGAMAVIASIQSIDPTAPGGEHQDEVGKAYDGNPETFWRTLTYKRNDFAGFKPAVGLQLMFTQTATVSTVTLHVNGTGGNVEVRTGDATTPTAGTVLASGPMSPDTVLHLSQPQTTQSLVIWFTQLPTTADGSFRVELTEIELG